MWRSANRSLTLLLLGVLFTACDPGEDTGVAVDGGGGGDGGPPDFPFADFGQRDGSSSGNLSCHLGFEGIAEDACLGCMTSSCGNELQRAFGTRGLPTRPGGACVDFLSCLDGCPCENDDCVLDCVPEVSQDCEDEIEVAQTCQADNCGEICDGGGPPPVTENFCTEAVGTIASGMSPFNGQLSEDDRSGGPRGDAFFDVYTVTLPEAGSLTVRMISDTLDTYLYAYDSDCSVLASDDDGGEGTNSTLTLPDGSAFVIATSFRSSEAGTYTIEVAGE